MRKLIAFTEKESIHQDDKIVSSTLFVKDEKAEDIWRKGGQKSLRTLSIMIFSSPFNHEENMSTFKIIATALSPSLTHPLIILFLRNFLNIRKIQKFY